MGGRGSSFGGSGGSAIPIPKINNPAGISSKAITEEEYLALRGYGSSISDFTIDKVGGANRTRLSARQEAKFQSQVSEAANQYSTKRAQAREEYQQLIKQGKIRDKTPLERNITKAHGNPDSPSVQAARRMVEKRGYDWRTGKKLKKKK